MLRLANPAAYNIVNIGFGVITMVVITPILN